MMQVDGSIKAKPIVVADIGAGGVGFNFPQDDASLEGDEHGVSTNLSDVGIVTQICRFAKFTASPWPTERA